MKRLILIAAGLLATSLSFADEIDFPSQVAPILAQHCVRCHHNTNPKGDVSLANRKDLFENEYVVPGDAAASHVLDLIQGVDGEPPEMPKDAEPLAPEQVAVVRNWINEGATWPEDFVVSESSRADSSWWSLQPINADGLATIDQFVLARLEKHHLTINPPADRRTLIRRVTYDLTGLPPTPAEVAKFESDSDPAAYEKLVDRLLDSPHYGERWGRHWLDVVRFGESIGYERNVIVNNIWPFRDYVIRSINEDKPFDEFIREHLAGDVFGKDDPNVAIGTAFLVAGPYDDVGNNDAAQAAQIRANTIDEMIRATSQAFLGLTVGCARCHDHKFDPILASDYYSFYSIFSGVRHGSVPLTTNAVRQARDAQLQPLERKRATIQQSIDELAARILQRGKDRLGEYQSQWTRPPVDRRGTEERFEPVTAKFVRLVCEARDSALNSSTGFGIDEFEVWSVSEGTSASRNVALLTEGANATGAARHIEDFKDAYSSKLAIDGRLGARFIAAGTDLTIELNKPTRIDRVFFSSARDAEKPEQGEFSFVAEYRIEVSSDGEVWHEVAHGRDRKPTTYGSNPSHLEHRIAKFETTEADRAERKRLHADLGQVRDEIAQIPALPSVWIGSRRAEDAAGPFHVFLGGDPQKLGKKVSTSSLSVLSDPSRLDSSFELESTANESARRMALADWIVSDANPLTARVLANRVWHYHFGQGIVNTPSDFGYMGDRPSHPELLDFLAIKLREFHWQLKPLHRLIMLSHTYQQSSDFNEAAARVDGDARLLWRFPPRRLSAEEIRDTILLLAGKIEKLPNDSNKLVPDGGPGFRLYHFMQDNVCTYAPLDEHGPETYRRAVYHQNARASVVDLMTEFDQPDCTFSAPKRAATTTPLQALTMLNHQFTLDMAKALADRLRRDAGDAPAEQIQLAFQLCYTRNASGQEVADCKKLLDEHGLTALCRVMLNTSELIYSH